MAQPQSSEAPMGDSLKQVVGIAQDQASEDVLLDSHGLPLIPQPSKWKDDPLNWSRARKWSVLNQVSFMAFLGPYNSAVVDLSLVTLAADFHHSTTQVSRTTTIFIIMGGVSPFFFGPFTTIYGRRSVTLFCQVIAILGNIGAANATTYSALLATRALNGIGSGIVMAIGTACISDMFFLHERGEETGVYTIFITNGAHIAAMAGGYLSQEAGWHWTFYLPAIITAASFLLALFAIAETLFSRDPVVLAAKSHERTYAQLLFSLSSNKIPNRRLELADFFYKFRMLAYPSVALPVWWYIWCWSFVNILPALTMSALYTRFYHFKTGPIGICLGLPLFIGTLVGEVTAGNLSDYSMYRLARRKNGIRKPEHRLYLTTVATFLMPAGIIMFGICVEQRYHYVVPLVGLSISCYGLQIASTCLYAYVADCYKPQTAETGVLMNLSRGMSFCLGFFALPLGQRIGYNWAWVTFALILWIFWLLILTLMVWGEKWRHRLPPRTAASSMPIAVPCAR